jgi:hypothetical protein
VHGDGRSATSAPAPAPAWLHARPGHGWRGVYGDYLSDAQGEDVVAGIRNTIPLQDLEESTPSYASCMASCAGSRLHYRDLCDIEFTIERGKLWMLQTRVGKRTPQRRSASRPSWSTSASSRWTRPSARERRSSSRS